MKQPPGIHNSGNICFASSVIHCLFNQELFRRALHDVREEHLPGCRECKQGVCIIAALHGLLTRYQYYGKSTVLPSSDIISSLQSMQSSFKPGKQHDSHEFLVFLMDLLMEHMTPEKAAVFKKDTHMDMTYTYTCLNCKRQSTTTHSEGYVEVHASTVADMCKKQKPQYVNDLFLNELEEEIVHDFKCPSCGHFGIRKCVTPSTTPHYLFLHVTKHNTGAGFPKSQIQEGYLRIGGAACYRLVGAVIHYRYGNNSGHYTSYFLDHGQKQWFLADDGMVRAISMSTVLQQDPTLLLYELCDENIHALSLAQCERLISGRWLTDEILQCYFELICHEAKKDAVNACVISSQFMTKLQTDGYKGVARWYRKINLMQQDVLYVLINHGQTHWTLLVLRNNQKIAEYYDSYGHDTTFYWQMLRTYFDTRSEKEGLHRNDWENWNYRAMKGIPQQKNSTDCGVFVSQNMIACDTCDKWYHWNCVGVDKQPDGNWCCMTCAGETKKPS